MANMSRSTEEGTMAKATSSLYRKHADVHPNHGSFGNLKHSSHGLQVHVRGYKEEGTITTPFNMTVLNDLDRFHFVVDTIERLTQTGHRGIYLKQQLKNKLIEHKQYIDKHGQDMPEIRNWNWRLPHE